MYFRLMGKLNARRQGLLAEDEKGFTLIELLVVVIIIGILAAIAIPVYMHIQDNAKDSAAKSDLENVKTALVAYYTDHNSFPTTIDSTVLGDYGYKGASGGIGTATDYIGTPGASSFCLDAQSGSNKWFTLSDSGSVTEATGTNEPTACS
jgi:prepilin-type N-terminal cleavage/methylation domain-containing protein